MRLRTQRALGLAFDDGGILLAEVVVSGARTILSRTAEFGFPAGREAADPASVGRALAQFLRTHRISARGAAIGIPAQWLVTKQVALPPADAASRTGMLRIQAERAFAHGAGELAVDYTCLGDASRRCTVLLCAAPRERIDRAVAIARAAGLHVTCVTPTAAALARTASAAAGDGAPRIDLLVGPGRIDAVVLSGGRIEALRHLAPGGDAGPAGSAWSERLSSEVRRMLMTRESAGAEGAGARLVLWDGLGLPAETIAALATTLALDECGVGSVGTLAELNGSDAACLRHAGAVALARIALDPTLREIDFLNSRLRPVAVRRFDRRLRAAAVVAAAVVLFVGWSLVDWQLAARAVSSLTHRLEAQAGQVQDARAVREKVALADGWFDARPEHLECLLELSRAFPEDGKIWATQISLSQDLRGVVSGRAVDDGAVLAVFERLQASAAFSEVTLHGGITYPKAAARDRNLAFSISFRMRGRQP